MGRPKKLSGASTGHLTKEQIEKKKQEEEILYNYEPLNFKKTPKSLAKGAAYEWRRISKYIRDLPISELDQQTVVRYCNYTFLYDDALQKLISEGPVIDGKKNPLVDVVNSYSKELKTATNDLGLTVNSRMKITKPAELEKEKDDPFGDMLGGK